MEINGYQLSRAWFDFCFDNPELINPNHTAIFMFAIEHCNRLGWKDKFGFPSQMTMDAIGIKNHHTYIKYFNNLVDWGFIKMVQRSSNQYSANVISLNCGMSKSSKALDKAFIKHAAKQPTEQVHSNPQSNDSIDKQLTINQEQTNLINNKPLEIWPTFNDFWETYNKKIDRSKCEKLWEKLNQGAREEIFETIELYVQSTPDVEFRKHPSTYLRNKSWQNEIIFKTRQQNGKPKFDAQATLDRLNSYGK